MEINGKTTLCGLIGNPVEHTMSPLIHNTLAHRLGHNMVYVPFLVEEQLEEAIKGAYALNIQGMNITVPYKEQVVTFLKAIDPLAAQIGAVNTLVRVKEGYKGYNTDMSGLYRAFCKEGIKIQGEKVIILGAGGAARAVAYLCNHYGASVIYLMNRNKIKAEEISEEINKTAKEQKVVPLSLEEYEVLPKEKMLCIQATSVGLAPYEQQVVIDKEEFYQRIHTGYDLIYRPSTTRFMSLVRNQGGRAFHGLKMLLYQGIEAYEKWNQCKVSEALCEEIYEKMKGEMKIEE